MSKITPLSTKTYGGGGKVLSLILAGTLAFGMTPAAALTQAALDVTPAYAADGDQPAASTPTLTAWTNVGTATLETAVPEDTTRTYVYSATAPTVDLPATFTVSADVTAASGQTGANLSWESGKAPADKTPATFNDVALDSGLYNYKVGFTKPDGTVVGDVTSTVFSSPTLTMANAGTYAVTVVANSPGGAEVDSSDPVSFVVAPKAVTAVSKASPVLGVSKPSDILGAAHVYAGPGERNDIKGTAATVEIWKGGTEITDTALNEVITEPGDYTLKFAFDNNTNYTYGAQDAAYKGTTEIKVPVQASQAYAVTFTDVGADTSHVAIKHLSDDVSATAAWSSHADWIATSLEESIKVKAGDDLLDAGSYTVAWFDAEGDALKNADGTTAGATPTLPGKYTGKVTVNGGTVVPTTLNLTVTSQVASDYTFFVGDKQTNQADDPIQLVWDKSLAGKDAEIKADVIAQVKKAFKAQLNGTSPAAYVDVENFDFKVEPAATPDGDEGTITISSSATAPSGVYLGNRSFQYKYGEDMPNFELASASRPFNGTTGYKVHDLVKVPTYQSQPFTHYTVTVAYVDAKGKQQVATDQQYITAVGDNYQVTVNATDNFAGSQAIETPFSITKRTIAKQDSQWRTTTPPNDVNTLTYNATTKTYEYVYDGEPAMPNPKVAIKFGDAVPIELNKAPLTQTQINEGKTADYEVSYANNAGVTGEPAVATVTGIGNYAGTFEMPFEVVAADLSKVNDLKIEAQSQLAEGFPTNPGASDVKNVKITYTNRAGKTITLDQDDYEISNVTKGATNAAGETTYQFTVKGKGNYTGQVTGTFLTVQKDISELWTAEVASGSYFYKMGNEVKPGVVVKRVSDKTPVDETNPANNTKNYRVTYVDNVDAGTATAVITGDGAYAGEIKATFEIKPLTISQDSAAKIVLDIPEGGYTYRPNTACEPEVDYTASTIKPVDAGYSDGAISLKELVDDVAISYPSTVDGATKAGTAQVLISGKGGNVVGSYAADFQVAQADIADAAIEVSGAVPGAPVEDSVVVKLGDDVLAAGTDYTVETEGSVPGVVTVSVTGAGNYTGTATKDVEVLYDLADATFTAAGSVYNGKAQTPKVEGYYMLNGKQVYVDPAAYTVAAGGYVNAGTYQVPVIGNNAEGWDGKTTAAFTIAPATVTAKPQVSYAGGLPVVTVPGLTSSDFDWKADAATQTITVTYKGNYKGTAKVAYTPTVAPGDPGSAQPAAGKTGWVGSGNDWAYYEGGQQVKGGWKLIGGEWYHFEKSGKMTNTKWFQDTDGTWYMLNQSHKGEYGAMLTGWQKDGGEWYHFAKSGAMQSGWAKVDGEWYLLNSKHDGTFGAMLTGWQKVGGKWYYMDASGAMAENEWVGRYWVDGSGVWTATR
ncbi:hypothetical protein GMI70_08685 [Eggerthellaceae bacterium zg-893]|nr:hypothetical protein [Eggerthellaceae bacterium zg-893]